MLKSERVLVKHHVGEMGQHQSVTVAEVFGTILEIRRGKLIRIIYLHTQFAALRIFRLAFFIVGANTFEDVRFCCRNFPLLKDDEILVNNVVETRQDALVDMTVVGAHYVLLMMFSLCRFLLLI